jgi:hypothetical protein
VIFVQQLGALHQETRNDVTVSRGLATETLHRGGWPAGLAPLARPALELKGPATPLPSVPHHTRFSFASPTTMTTKFLAFSISHNYYQNVSNRQPLQYSL